MKKFLLVIFLALSLEAGAESEKRNIILISVDTLRKDHLSCYGYKRKTSLNIDALLKKGIKFENAITNIPLTNPSFASMFTSRYPHEIGAMRNGLPMQSSFETLAEILKKNHYTNVAFLSNWPLKARLSNLDQGFDIYDDNFVKKRWLLFNSERDAQEVTELAIRWLEQRPKEPFFLWAHYSEPHAPYVVHRGFKFGSSQKADENQQRIDAYDSEVAYTDHYIGLLVQKIDELSLFSRSLVIFLSDHGESLGEHFYTGHGRYVYQDCMDIPFGIVAPELPKGITKDAQFELLDLTPTILGYLGIPVPDGMRGRNFIPYLKGEEPLSSNYLVYYETFPGAVRGEELAEKVKDITKPLWVGLKLGKLKVMYSVRFSRWEMYNLGSDPGELKNLADPADQKFIRLSDEVLRWYHLWEKSVVVGKTDAMTEEDRKKFESLGYTE